MNLPSTDPAPPTLKLRSFSWLNDRMAGVLVHPTAFPSWFGIGAFD